MNSVRIAVMCVVSAGALAGVAHPVPARADLPPFLCQTGSSALPGCGVGSIEGSEWTGTASTGEAEDFVFNSGGVLHYLSQNGNYYDNATWTVSGNHVTMSMNDGYAVYQGTIDGNRMDGTASNVVGRHWGWSVHRR